MTEAIELRKQEMTLDELTERLSRIERVQEYLNTLKEGNNVNSFINLF